MALLTSARSLRPADWVIVVVVLALFTGPAVVLAFDERPARFGFQMYSGYGEAEATWRDPAGTDHPIDLRDHVAVPRWEVDWTEVLPTALCGRLDGAVSVEVRQRREEGHVTRRVTC